MIVQVLNILRFFTWIGKNTVDRHFAENTAAWNQYYAGKIRVKNVDVSSKQPGLLNSQVYITEQSRLNFLYYGKNNALWERLIRKQNRPLTADFNACEVIAVINALISLGLEKDAYSFPELLRHFEGNHGLILMGYFGTAPAALWKYLKQRGIRLTFFRPNKLIENMLQINTNKNENNSHVNNNQIKNGIRLENNRGIYKTYIVIFQNSEKNLSQGIHTICMQVDINGARLLNDYAGNRYYSNEMEAMKAYNNGEAKVLQLVELTK